MSLRLTTDTRLIRNKGRGILAGRQAVETHIHTAYYDKHKLGRYANVNNHLGIGSCEAILQRHVTNLTAHYCNPAAAMTWNRSDIS
jgi:hypothetical protein